jgi:hypothetical protein
VELEATVKDDKQVHGRRQESQAERSGISERPEVAPGTNRTTTSSARKIEANRRNALKSTGPRTRSGKKRVSRNATRHGFFSKWLLIQGQNGNESQQEYDDFCAGLRKHFDPVGWLEELWVEKIAVWSWRLRRLIRFESGQISLALARHSCDLRQSRADELAEPESTPLSDPGIDAMTDHLFLPEKEELDKLLRYEAMINRQLNHAIAELERVQARWKGGIHRDLVLRNKATKFFSFNRAMTL